MSEAQGTSIVGSQRIIFGGTREREYLDLELSLTTEGSPSKLGFLWLTRAPSQSVNASKVVATSPVWTSGILLWVPNVFLGNPSNYNIFIDWNVAGVSYFLKF